MSGSLSEPEFERLADEELKRLVQALDEVGEDVDAELQMGVLSILFDDGSKFVVNSHRAAGQIWMAAERQAWHFDYQAEGGGRWLTAKGEELWSSLSEVLGRKVGQKLSLGSR